MASYTKSTNFASKDTLLTGNPLKVIKGTEIDDEFNAIQTAVNSKADSNSPTLTGTPTAPTATAGTNTTQIASTAFVQAALAAVYPVGSVYINAASATNPSTLLGFGTWVEFGSGRVLVGQNTEDASFNTLEETGGSKDSVVVSHTHTATVTDPGHTHLVWGPFGGGGNPGGSLNTSNPGGRNHNGLTTNTTGISVSNSTAGESGTNKNLQPYIVVKMWKRTA